MFGLVSFIITLLVIIIIINEPENTFTLIVRLTRHLHDTSFRSLAINFKLCDTVDYAPPEGHTHGTAAYERFRAVHSIRTALKDFTQYDPSLARRDTAYAGVGGHRFPHSVKDLSAQLPLRCIRTGKIVVTLIDQDYYFSDLCQFGGKPIVLYTMCVNALSGVGNDSQWYFDSPECVVETVKGGASYRQRLFDYGSDQLVIPYWKYGLIPCFTVYEVHTKRVGTSNKMVVFLCPASTHYQPIWLFSLMTRIFMGHWMKFPTLGKMNSVKQHGNFLVGKFSATDGAYYSIKRCGDISFNSCVNLPEGVFLGLQYLSKNLTKSWSAGEVERYSTEWGHPIRGTDLPTVCEFFSTPYVPGNSVNVFIPPNTSLGDLMTDVGRLKGRLAAPSIVENPATVLSTNDAAHRSYVEERMIPNKNTAKFDEQLIAYAEEYVRQLVRQPHKCVPITLEELLTKQNNPRQRARNNAELGHLAKDQPRVKTFMKSEAGLKDGPARGVNSCATSHTWLTGRFSYGLKPMLSSIHHYVVGLPPMEIAKRVQGLARNARAAGRCVNETDFSKLDETISDDIRTYIFEPFMYRAFVKEVHEELKKALEDDKHSSGNVGSIHIPDMGPKNISGSGFTTVINTVTSPFPLFVFYRTQGFSIIDSFKFLGVAFGDDGLSLGVPYAQAAEGAKVLTEIATKMGLKLKVITHDEKSPLFFLGRSYPTPSTSLVSMGLPSKVLPKLPVTLSELPQNIIDRFRGYYVTERHVPLVKEYIEAVARVLNFPLEITPEAREKLFVTDKDLYHRVRHGPFPYSESDEEALLNNVCLDTNLTRLEVQQRCAALVQAKTLADFDLIKINNIRINSQKYQRSQ